MTGYPLQRLREEVAFIAYYFHWDFQTLLQLDHAERQRWCREISKIHRQVNGNYQHSLLDEV